MSSFGADLEYGCNGQLSAMGATESSSDYGSFVYFLRTVRSLDNGKHVGNIEPATFSVKLVENFLQCALLTCKLEFK